MKEQLEERVLDLGRDLVFEKQRSQELENMATNQTTKIAELKNKGEQSLNE